ncbi:MAG: hypothetical protein ACLUOI_27765 [Eisenbergiella sp.]
MDNRSKFWRGVMVGVLVTAFACLVTVGTSAGIYMFGRRVIDNQVQVQAEQGNSGGRRAPTVGWQSDSRYGARQQKAYGASDDY